MTTYTVPIHVRPWPYIAAGYHYSVQVKADSPMQAASIALAQARAAAGRAMVHVCGEITH